MMIGIDIIKIDRVKSAMERRGQKFVEYIASGYELDYLISKNFSVESVAGLFAAKEAMAKAMGTGIGKLGLKNLEVLYGANGQPFGKYKNQEFKLSISHEREYAIAVAVMGEKRLEIPKEVKDLFPKVQEVDHKGSRGRAGIIAGSLGMLGSAYLSTTAALRIGAGYAYHIVDKELMDLMSLKFIEEIVVSMSPQADVLKLIESLDSLAVGPGIGRTNEAKEKVKLALGFKGPLVIDADGLNLLSENIDLLKVRKPYTTILTPHLGEFQRLTGLSRDEISENRIEVSRSFAVKHKIILVLKGPHTVVSDREGIYINETGNPGLATAGSGDVLTGMITGLLAQGLKPMEAGMLGVAIHGLCGDYLLKTHSPNAILAHDLVDSISQVTKLFYK